MILTLFLAITILEVIVIALKVKNIREHIQLAKEIGVQTRFAKPIDKTEQLFIRLYENYRGMFFVLGAILLIINLFAATIIGILIETIQHIIK